MEQSQNTETIGMVIEVNKDKDEIINILKNYVPVEYWDVFDWNIIVYRCKNINDKIFQFDLFLYSVYFNVDMKPIEYDNQYIIDGEVYLDLNEDSSKGAGTYHYIGDMPR